MEACTGGVAHVVSQALEGETHRIDQPHACPDQTVAQLYAQQILLRLGAAVTHRVEERGIKSADPGQHLRIAPVALAFVLVNRAQLARISDQDSAALVLQEAAHPRTMTTRLHHDQREAIMLRQLSQRAALVRKTSLTHHLSQFIEHAKSVPPVT